MKIAQVPGGEIPFSRKLLGTPFAIPLISYLLTEELVKRGHEVTAFVPSDSETSAKIAPGWIPSVSIGHKKFKFGTKERGELWARYWENVKAQADKFDIIHVHETILGILDFLKGIKTPPVVTFHGSRLWKRTQKKFSKQIFIGLSKKQIKNNPKMKFVGMVYNGIPVSLFPFNNKPKDYLFWLGRISPEKGALEAIKISQITNQKLIMAGNIPPYPSCNQKYIKKVMAGIRKNRNIKFLGPVNFKKKIKYLKNAFALLFPIKWEEPFGLVMLEAMACGTPVIAFSRGAVPEIVKNGKTGFLVKTIPQMAKAIGRIPEISRRDCRVWVKKNFSVEKMADGYEKIFKKVIKKYKKN